MPGAHIRPGVQLPSGRTTHTLLLGSGADLLQTSPGDPGTPQQWAGPSWVKHTHVGVPKDQEDAAPRDGQGPLGLPTGQRASSRPERKGTGEAVGEKGAQEGPRGVSLRRAGAAGPLRCLHGSPRVQGKEIGARTWVCSPHTPLWAPDSVPGWHRLAHPAAPWLHTAAWTLGVDTRGFAQQRDGRVARGPLWVLPSLRAETPARRSQRGDHPGASLKLPEGACG